MPHGLLQMASNVTFDNGAGDNSLVTCSKERVPATPGTPDALALLTPHSRAKGSLSVSRACSAPENMHKALSLAWVQTDMESLP